jgi:hypothetical protein
MLFWTIQVTILSILLIFLVHHLINFFKSTLTVPKIKDLVNAPTQKYENIYSIINNSSNHNNDQNLNEITTLPKTLPKNPDNMKSELKSFLKSQLQESNTYSNDVLSIDNMSISYSTY